jgi:hypothetical protein
VPVSRLAAAAVTCLLAGAVLAGGTGGLEEIEIKSDPPKHGEVLYTVRLRPAETRDYSLIVFECRLCQEFQWQDSRGRETTKIHEPVSFTYRFKEKDGTRLVHDLDKYISFRVPISITRLKAMYGPTTFRPDVPVTVSQIRIIARAGKDIAWSYEVPPAGKHPVGNTP